MDRVTTVPDAGVCPSCPHARAVHTMGGMCAGDGMACHCVRFPDSPDEPVNWWRSRDGYAHAFRGTSEYDLSLCGRDWWRVPVPTDAARCPDCTLLVDGAPGEITEAWGK